MDHALDLTPTLATSETGDGRRQPPCHPVLLVYASCTGTPASWRIEKATHEEVPYSVLAPNQHPDHDSRAAFRQQHLQALAGLFIQGLALCRGAGVMQLGHGALDGTTVRANASKHSHSRSAPGALRCKERINTITPTSS